MGLDHPSGHLDRAQRKSRRKWLSPWGEMPRLTLSDQGIGRKDGQGQPVKRTVVTFPASFLVLRHTLHSDTMHTYGKRRATASAARLLLTSSQGV